MAKADRLSQQVNELELEYCAVFTRALTNCAAGQWGLFGHNEHLHSYGIPPELGELRELARTIDRLRARIGEPQFPLHEEFEAARGRTDANDPGEPKQAQAWLKRLAAT
jgi:hypothetical protein